MRAAYLHLFLIIVLMLLPVGLLAAQMIYTADDLPLDAGWQLILTSSVQNGNGITSSIVNDAGGNVWQLVDASSAYRCAVGTTLPSISFDTGVTVAARVKCTSIEGNLSYNLGISKSGTGGMFLSIRPDRIELTIGAGMVRASHAADGTGYHTYYLTVKTTTPGSSGTAVWRVYRDGVEVITFGGAGGSLTGLSGLFAGHYGTSSAGEWKFDWIAGRDDGAFAPAQWNPVPGEPLPPPVVTSPSNGAVVSTSTVPVQWTAAAHTAYQVRMNKTNNPSDGSVWDSGCVTSPGSSCTATPLENGQVYVFVRLRNSTGWGQWSATGHSFTWNQAASLPSAPDIVLPHNEAVARTQKPIAEWIGSSHNMYQIRVNTTNSPDDADIWDSGPVIGSANSHEMGLLPIGSFYVFIRLHTLAGWGPWTAPGRTFQVESPVDLKRGWVLLRDDMNAQLAALSKAREYRVNHVQLSHDIIMYRHQPINDIERRWRINQLIDAAHSNGVEEVVLWIHEADYMSMPTQYLVNGRLNLDAPGYWTWLDSQYELLFDACPDADGLVLTLSENFTGDDILDPNNVIHNGRSPEDSVTMMIGAIWNVCKRHNKSLYVRTWTNSGGPDRWIRNAILRNDPAIWMYSKPTGAADYNVIQESYDIIGTATGHKEMIEFDVVGEYWGLTTVPWAGIDYIKQHWSDFALPRGASGIVARVDRDDGKVIETPNRINMHALDVVADYPHAPTDDILRYWCWNWFGDVAGDRVASALKRSFDITNACYYLPTIYPFSGEVARKYCLQSLFDYDYVNSALKAQTGFQPGAGNNYDLLRDQMETAATKLGISPIPTTLFGDFSPAYSTSTSPACSVAVVDASYGIRTSSFASNYVQYSTNGGATWTNVPYTWSATGSSTDPYIITVNSVPFNSRAAGANKIRFRATTNDGVTCPYWTYAVRGLDHAYATLGGSVVSDGIYHPQGGDGDTVSATAGGRPCRRLSSGTESNFYFQVDDGFAYDRSPSTLYLQVDYYGSSGSITPVYDSAERTDETLSPVHLNGGSGWRRATWRLDNVNFGNRVGPSGDIRLYVGGNTGVYISDVRLSYAVPTGYLDAPCNLQGAAVSSSGISLTWNGVSGATQYQISRDGNNAGWTTGTSFTVSGLAPNSQYAYRIMAYDAAGNVSPASDPRVVTTLASPPSVACNKSTETWHTTNDFTFSVPGGFGSGSAAYYRYVWNESPTHQWTGSESSWPSVDAPAAGSGWSTWLPTHSPSDKASGWLLYEGSTTQRLTSEEMVNEDGVPAWKYSDQGRVFNTKTKFGRWPGVPINLNTGATFTVRMKAADSPLGWLNNGVNIGFNTSYSEECGAIIRPDRLQLSADDLSATVSPDNGYSYHTYTLTVKNDIPGNNATTVYTLYRDGQYMLDQESNSDGSPSSWPGPMFGHATSNALGVWYYQWMAWRNDGAFIPAPPESIALIAPHYGRSFYLHLRSYNADGKPGDSISLGPYRYWDGTTPIPPEVTDNGSYTTRNAMQARWTEAGPDIDRYEYAFGTSPGAQNVVPWTSAGTALEISRDDLSLTEGQSYYVSVRGVEGSTSGEVGSSDGITAAPTYEKIGMVRNISDGLPAALYHKTVTAVFPDCAYLQEPAGPGIKIISDQTLELGRAVDVAGKMSDSGSERSLTADTLLMRGEGEDVTPVFMVNRTIGGSGASPNVPELSPPSPGPSNMSRLATVSGVVQSLDQASNGFTIDDKSGVLLKCLLPPGSPLPQISKRVVVTGVISLQPGEFGFIRALRIRSEDIVHQF